MNGEFIERGLGRMVGKIDTAVLERLVEIPAVPGREGQIAEYISSQLPDGYDHHLDALGNLTVHIPAKGKRVMLVAHMDEVGLIVQRILPEGFLRVERMGGTSLRALPGSSLSLWSQKGRIPAVAGVLPQHLDDGNTIGDFSSIYVDIGTSSADESRAMGVRPGDVLTWDSPLQYVGDSLVRGKALDDRLGCFVLLELVKSLDPQKLNCDLFVTFTVQEETMLMGGMTAANTIEPEVIIGVDGTLAFDTPDLEGKQCDIRLGSGPAVKWMDAIRGKMAAFVPDQSLVGQVCDLAQKMDIPLQDEITVGMSTAVTPLLYAASGAKACALSIPVRFHHTPIETADLRDVKNTIELLQNLLLDGFH